MTKVSIGLVMICFISCLCSAQDQDLESFFDRGEAIERLDQIKEALFQFRDFTQSIFDSSDLGSKHDIYVLYENSIPVDADITVGLTGQDFQRDGYLNWDMQNIGFPNWTKYIQGYIEYLELRNNKFILELAILENQSAGAIDSLKAVIKNDEERLMNRYLKEEGWVD